MMGSWQLTMSRARGPTLVGLGSQDPGDLHGGAGRFSAWRYRQREHPRGLCPQANAATDVRTEGAGL
jgi:hypothetical protein